MKMTTKIKMQRWIPALITAAALAGFASLCQAQVSPITYDFSSGLEGWTDFSGIAGNTVSWNATGGPTGGGCAEYTFDGTGSVSQYGTLALPGVAFSPSINSLSYATVDVDVNFSGEGCTAPAAAAGKPARPRRDGGQTGSSRRTSRCRKSPASCIDRRHERDDRQQHRPGQQPARRGEVSSASSVASVTRPPPTSTTRSISPARRATARSTITVDAAAEPGYIRR